MKKSQVDAIKSYEKEIRKCIDYYNSKIDIKHNTEEQNDLRTSRKELQCEMLGIESIKKILGIE